MADWLGLKMAMEISITAINLVDFEVCYFARELVMGISALGGENAFLT